MRIGIGSLLAVVCAAPMAARAASQYGEPQGKLTGFYAQVDAGAFSGLQGSKGISNAEPYVGFALGYDLTRDFSLYGAVSHGSSASNCYMEVLVETCVDGTTKRTPVADNFSMMFFEAGAAYTIDLAVRVGLALRAVAGGVILDPLPKPGLNMFGGSFGGGLGLEYATRFDGMTIGFDVIGRFVLPASIPSLSYSGRFKYVF